MSRLQSELYRLYLPHSSDSHEIDNLAPILTDQNGMVRAMLLELARPADWEELSRVWRGVQTDLELPAPAVAVSGTDAFQLWFSLTEAVPVSEARAFVESLCARYLPDVAPKRIALLPAVDATPAAHARLAPALQERTAKWSAFVTADLAPIFADTPWMDSQPGNDGQAGILSRLLSITRPAFEAAQALLIPATPAFATPTQALTSTFARAKPEPIGESAQCLDPKRFLLQVMNDDSTPLALRIEAAKALLPYSE